MTLDELDNAIKRREEAKASRLYETDRSTWYHLCAAVDRIEELCAKGKLLCANYNVSCRTPRRALIVTDHGESFCCSRCAKEFWDEMNGTAKQREEDMRDY